MDTSRYESKSQWKPHSRQTAVLRVPNSVKEIFYGGAAGGGKTDLGVVLPIVRKCNFTDRMWYQHPKFKGLIIRRTIPEVKKELMDRCKEYYRYTGCKVNETDRKFTWPWGAQMWLASAEHEDDVRNYDTEQFNYIFFEELTSFTEFMYLYMLSRNRSADPDLPSIMFSASNPGNVGHGWVRKRFVEPYRDGGKIIRQFFFHKDGSYIVDDEGAPKYIDRIFIRALGSDNPHLLKNDPTYLTSLEALPEAEKAAKLYGDWWTYSGQVFDSFRAKRFPDEPENALHVIPEFVVPDWWPRILAIDWGYKAATVGLWGAISPSGRVFIYREYYVRETEVAIWGSEIGELCRGEDLRAIVLDTNAWDNRGEEKTIAVQFQEKFSEAYGKVMVPEQASKGRVSGKVLVQEFLRWKQKPVYAHQPVLPFNQDEADRLRRLSDALYQKYVDSYAPPEVEDNIPKLQIFDTCKRLIETIPLCVYDDNNVEDVKEWQATDSQVGDDCYDDLRYLLKRIERYLYEAVREQSVRAKEEKVVKIFNETGDTTGYYRRMEHLEKTGYKRRGSVRRPSFRQKYVVH